MTGSADVRSQSSTHVRDMEGSDQGPISISAHPTSNMETHDCKQTHGISSRDNNDKTSNCSKSRDGSNASSRVGDVDSNISSVHTFHEHQDELTQGKVPEPESTHIAGQPFRRKFDHHAQTPGYMLPMQLLQDTSRSDRVTHREIYLLKVCRAFMMYGAPTHRLEEYMRMTAGVLGLHLQSFYLPGCMIISSSSAALEPPQVHTVRCAEALDLSKLQDVHVVYKDVIHKKVAVEQANASIDNIIDQDNKFPLWIRILAYGLSSAFIGPVSYEASPIDLPIIFVLGCMVGAMELILAKKSELYAHVFEISAAILVSFLARAFGSIDMGSSTSFCFPAICQASLVLILPGLLITNSALELQSKNIVSGSVRMVYGVIFTVFLAFGITVGAAVYGAIDSDAVSATTCATTRPFWWQVTFVVPFTLCYVVVNQGKWAKMPATLILSLIGWLVNHFSAQRFAGNAQITQALGALTVGLLANLYSRLGYGLAIVLLYPAIFIQVPGSFAASGSLIIGVVRADQLDQSSNSTAGAGKVQPNTEVLKAGYSMIEIAIGITVGLSVSALVVYPIRKKTGKSGLFSF